MKEANRHALEDALKRLPGYEPNSQLWEEIEADLSHPPTDEQQHETLQRSLDQLPSYRAPEWLWNRVEKRLAQKPVWPWITAIAAGLALLIGIGWLLRPSQPPTPAQATESRPARELTLPEASPAEFLDALSDSEMALWTCLQAYAPLPDSVSQQWQQLQRWAAEPLHPQSDSARHAIAAALRAAYCAEK